NYSWLDTIILKLINVLFFIDKVISKLFNFKPFSQINYLNCKKESIIFSKLDESYKKVAAYDPKNNVNPNVIWTAWFQGIDAAPSLVKICIESFSKLKGYDVIIITLKNYNQYVTLPQEIIDKFNNGIIGYTAFSEIIRIELLSIYGGIWMDSTVYIHKAIEETLLEKEFLTLKGVEKLRPGKHLGLIPVYFIGCESNYPPILKVRDYLLSYWIHNDKQIDYFLIDYCFKLVVCNDADFSRYMNAHPLNGIDRFKLIELMNTPYNEIIKNEIDKCNCGAFKLSNKYKLKTRSSKGKDTFWGHILKHRAL
ncbi:TPA: capsular polysaccharide synthesis protein, partial [Escherichia coli]|nr:hypothetical protein [Escherichia coli]